MLILTIRTDKPESELGLYSNSEQVGYLKWEAHRQLAETIHLKLEELLNYNDYKLDKVDGIIYYQGPGSFTGLRIGASVANALAYSLKAPIVGVEGESWITSGIERLLGKQGHKIALPKYGQPINITKQKK